MTRKQYIQEYVLANPEPKRELLPNIVVRYKGNSKKYDGEYTNEYFPLTGKKFINNPNPLKPNTIITPPSKSSYYTLYAEIIPNSDPTLEMLELSAIEINVARPDKTKNVDRRHWTFPSISYGVLTRIFLFKNDPTPYLKSGDPLYPEENTKYYNKFLYKNLNQYSNSVITRPAIQTIYNFFSVTDPLPVYPGYWHIQQAYKTYMPRPYDKKDKEIINSLNLPPINTLPTTPKNYIYAHIINSNKIVLREIAAYNPTEPREISRLILEKEKEPILIINYNSEWQVKHTAISPTEQNAEIINLEDLEKTYLHDVVKILKKENKKAKESKNYRYQQKKNGIFLYNYSKKNSFIKKLIDAKYYNLLTITKTEDYYPKGLTGLFPTLNNNKKKIEDVLNTKPEIIKLIDDYAINPHMPQSIMYYIYEICDPETLTIPELTQLFKGIEPIVKSGQNLTTLVPLTKPLYQHHFNRDKHVYELTEEEATQALKIIHDLADNKTTVQEIMEKRYKD